MSPQPGPRSFKIGGKAFLIGEYAVLAGAPAVVACLPPLFELRAERTAEHRPSTFHPQSPAGLLEDEIARQCEERLAVNFLDPHDGAGGLGASTAQFALLYRAYQDMAGWSPRESAWKMYRRLTAGRASGADLVAQSEGGVVTFRILDQENFFCESIADRMDWAGFLVFTATGQPGRKVATHEHLAGRGGGDAVSADLLRDLREPIHRALSGIRAGSARELGRAMGEYARALSKWDLEVPAARADREAMEAVPGVAGAKGAGALLSDLVVVLLESPADTDARGRVLEIARERRLNLISNGEIDRGGLRHHG